MTVIKISVGALAHNIEKCRSMTDARIMAVLKCNGYGMGIIEYAEHLKKLGITDFAVSRPDEALMLRKAGYNEHLVLLTAMWDDEMIETLALKNVALTVASPSNDDKVRSVLLSRGLNAKVHLAVDTGMHRYGFTKKELETYSDEGVPYEIEGVFTHFFASTDRELTEKQHAEFIGIVEGLKNRGINTGLIHCCASNAFMAFPEFHHDMVRLGSALIGSTPGTERIWRFEVTASSVKKLSKHSPLGYGGWKTPKSVTVATLPVGFSDGIMLSRYEPADFIGKVRNFARDVLRPTQPTHVFFGDHEVGLLGGAGTTHISVDVTGLHAKEGDVFTVSSNPMFFSEDIVREYID